MSDKKTSIRPILPNTKFIGNENNQEKFQNEVLRPIIKLQNSLILICFHHFLNKLKVDLKQLNEQKRKELIKSLLRTNSQLMTELRGLIIGLLTSEEYSYYLNHRSSINKRIHSIIQIRIESNNL